MHISSALNGAQKTHKCKYIEFGSRLRCMLRTQGQIQGVTRQCPFQTFMIGASMIEPRIDHDNGPHAGIIYIYYVCFTPMFVAPFFLSSVYSCTVYSHRHSFQGFSGYTIAWDHYHST